MNIISKETAEDLKWAAKIIQDHVTGSKPAQTALEVRTHKDGLFRLRDRLERLASRKGDCTPEWRVVMYSLAAFYELYFKKGIDCVDTLQAVKDLMEAYDKWLD